MQVASSVGAAWEKMQRANIDSITWMDRKKEPKKKKTVNGLAEVDLVSSCYVYSMCVQ